MAPFSSSASVAAVAVKKATAASSRQGHIIKVPRKKNYKKKTASVARQRPPAPGERKAFRKRIQLSNNNALAVSGLLPLSKESMADPESQGRMFALTDELVDKLRTMEAFKSSQSWGLFRQPSTLVLSESVQLVEKLPRAAVEKEALRLAIYGERISGKSMMLLHAMANGFLNDWVVINIPEGMPNKPQFFSPCLAANLALFPAQELTTACTEYARLPGTEPAQYVQPVYISKLLSNIRRANDKVLSSLKVHGSHAGLPVRIPPGATLAQLAALPKDAEQAWPILRALWAELTDRSVPRPPVMFVLDGLAHIMRFSDYRSPSFELIHSHDLSLVRLFSDALAGTLELPHGGAILAATSRGNAQRNMSLDLALAQRQAEQDRELVPPRDPYCRLYDERVDSALRTVQVMKLNSVSKAEARSLLEYWAASGLLRAAVDERTVVDRWSVGGHGIVGEMERASLLNLRM